MFYHTAELPNEGCVVATSCTVTDHQSLIMIVSCVGKAASDVFLKSLPSYMPETNLFCIYFACPDVCHDKQ